MFMHVDLESEDLNLTTTVCTLCILSPRKSQRSKKERTRKSERNRKIEGRRGGVR